ncbi:uncharacterized protein BO96DRAFT_447861 [Aspergillus niger CBS 101883]|uniref:uncharacterized protein n=1 Tax=Aspergillus lacticoffeatus (strain CBS 101883) TaxID=1450533 RepID=UPI000D7FC1A3|nr:uncharacterized protein BO96DRAFT_447861 [Aspergillus niger CBS 101883]PYH54688.1 hypothetical protein BO96DRAFT_447861 [Aspergillus niger CBS 101883]
MRDLSLDAGRNYKGPICGIHAVQGYIVEFVVAVAGRSNESVGPENNIFPRAVPQEFSIVLAGLRTIDTTALNQVQIRVRPAGLNECPGDEICRLVRTQVETRCDANTAQLLQSPS